MCAQLRKVSGVTAPLLSKTDDVTSQAVVWARCNALYGFDEGVVRDSDVVRAHDRRRKATPIGNRHNLGDISNEGTIGVANSSSVSTGFIV